MSFYLQMQKLFEELESHFCEEQEKTKIEVSTTEHEYEREPSVWGPRCGTSTIFPTKYCNE